ncbi:hypothetical protein TIFTF001_002153 [Ficus carica]|uniref:Uncharacterized protein n=1 Tax=Ficus carica TaxID=3494 RepID=A0AA88CNQ5_FICCA|nr:hypothetical protein TIFTF001_002153 [Ficus carica]
MFLSYTIWSSQNPFYEKYSSIQGQNHNGCHPRNLIPRGHAGLAHVNRGQHCGLHDKALRAYLLIVWVFNLPTTATYLQCQLKESFFTSFVVAVLTWRVGVRGLLWLVQLTSSWRQGNVLPEIPQATSGGRTPEQLVGVPVVLCQVNHNVGPGWDKLNPDDPDKNGSEGDTCCDSSLVWMKTSHKEDLNGRLTVVCSRVGMNDIEVVVYFERPIPKVLRHWSCRRKLWCIGEGAPPSRSSQVERGHLSWPKLELFAVFWAEAVRLGDFSSHGFLLFPGMVASGSGITLPLIL